MNEILRGILIIYVISTLFYLIYSKYTSNKINNIIDNLDEENKNEYNKINKYRTFVFIIGILLGIGVLVFIEPNTIKKSLANISDVSDINVIS
jgi:hypothetical protein